MKLKTITNICKGIGSNASNCCASINDGWTLHRKKNVEKHWSRVVWSNRN